MYFSKENRYRYQVTDTMQNCHALLDWKRSLQSVCMMMVRTGRDTVVQVKAKEDVEAVFVAMLGKTPTKHAGASSDGPFYQ